MPISPSALKAQLLAIAEAKIDEMLVQAPAPATASLAEIEQAALAVGQHLAQAVAGALVTRSAQEPVRHPMCPQCGAKLKHKGRPTRRLETLAGEVSVTRVYYHCRACQQGFFPPRSAVGD